MFINVAIGILIYENNFLLVKRKKGNFPNLWGLIGGKVEDGEHIDEAIVRELREETEISVKFNKLLGVSTEMVTDNNVTTSTVLYCCLVELEDNLSIINYNSKESWFSKSEKLELKWFDEEELNSRNDIVGSDLDFIKHFYFLKDVNYLRVDCRRDKQGQYVWKIV